MKFVSWNVNGIRAAIKKDFEAKFEDFNADFFCLQETKLSKDQLDLSFDGYVSYYNYAEKKGYSGTAIYTKHVPNNVEYGIGIEEHDHEGRVITLEYDKYFIVTVYTPNSKRDLERLDYRIKWERDFLNYLKGLNEKKPVIICGDLNVAHKEIDLKNDKTNHFSAGFTDEERAAFTRLLEGGFVDTYRYLYPNKEEVYSWWSYMGKARERNTGWRIDYFIVSKDIENKIEEATVEMDILGSDHCPVTLTLEI